ncbi:DUF6503 family protein [Flagellimonas marina]|uniref:DUF6503 family protein n=1 Tax=Flagellimonas marina TaxID=1775168 RepID=A0ABV8PLB7_9FLAO
MKRTTTLLLLLAIAACKPTPKKEETQQTVQEKTVETQPQYPEALSKVFDAHGGIKKWKQQHTLTYILPKPENPETHTVDLWSRKDRIDFEHFSMGFDGNDIWLLDPNQKYEGDPAFYHNLMFYFYGMPFLLADDGIVYSETEDLVFEGKSYPGIHIGYNSGVGISSKDEYVIHFDPETYQMAWLGYTVTYRTGEKSDNVKWIRYNDWQDLNGVLLPKSITWYNYEGRDILDPSSTVSFEEATISTTSKPDNFYAKPEGATVIEPKVN